MTKIMMMIEFYIQSLLAFLPLETIQADICTCWTPGIFPYLPISEIGLSSTTLASGGKCWKTEEQIWTNSIPRNPLATCVEPTTPRWIVQRLVTFPKPQETGQTGNPKSHTGPLVHYVLVGQCWNPKQWEINIYIYIYFIFHNIYIVTIFHNILYSVIIIMYL